MELPIELSDKASEFPETYYGATIVTLVLRNSQKINNVTLAWGTEIVKIDDIPINEVQEIGFQQKDIIDVLQSKV